jgi:hypothetical protein
MRIGNKKNAFVIATLSFLLIFFLANSLNKKMWSSTNTAPIVWDGFGYYFYLPTFFYDDFKDFKNIDYIKSTYNPTFGNSLAVKKAPNGNLIMRYPIGCSFMMLPGFLFAHYLSAFTGFPQDGFSIPYQFSMTIWSLVVAWFGLVILSIVLRKYFSDLVTSSALLVVGLSSNFFIYTSYSQLHSHVYLFTLYALIIYLTNVFYRKEKTSLLLVSIIGALCGLATATRPTEAISFLIPFLWGVGDISDLKNRLTRFFKEPLIPFLFLLFCLIGVLPQLLYWKIYAGSWLFYSYEDDQTFSFLKPHLFNFLFSYQKGWFTYTPIMYLSIIGLILLFFKKNKNFWTIAIFMTLNLYIISSWDCWWYGGSFSQRAVIQSYPLLAFSIAFFLNSLKELKILRIPTIIFILFCTWLNLFMSFQTIYCDNVMESDAMTKSYFWRIFGKTSVTKHDRMLLDTDEQIPICDTSKIEYFYSNSFDGTNAPRTNYYKSPSSAIFLNVDKQHSDTFSIKVPKDVKWLRAKVLFYAPWEEWNMWKWAQFQITLKNSNGESKSKFVRCQRQAKYKAWSEIYVDIKNESKFNFDVLEIKIWNGESETHTYFDDLKIGAIK